MHDRASFLKEQLQLTPHPEGGFYREIYRSPSFVTEESSGRPRSALTSIYYLLPAGQVSRLHRVASDEVWHFLDGDPLTLHVLDPAIETVQTYLLGPVAGDARPIHVVPANHWQAAVPTGAFTLVGCTMGPGFEFEDFALLAQNETLSQIVRARYPRLSPLL